MTKTFKTEVEQEVGKRIERIFVSAGGTLETKIENFPKYVRRQQLKRFLAFYELFKRILPVKGSIVECGVYRGFGLMSWAKLSTILEPENPPGASGFDTFDGFPSVHSKDQGQFQQIVSGDLSADCYEELLELVRVYDDDRFLGHIPKLELIRGDITRTVPEFIGAHPHLCVSLLFLDCDVYEPTKTAIECFVPRMPRGAIIAFDELDNPLWPGETMALLETLGVRRLALQRLEWDPYIGFAVLE
jgi:hypothetical protein